MSGIFLHGSIYNSFEDDTISYSLKETKIKNNYYEYNGQIGYAEDKIYLKFRYDRLTHIACIKSRYRYCLNIDNVEDYCRYIFTDSMSDQPDSDIFACFRFPKENKIIPISDVFKSIFPNKLTILLDRDYSR